MLKKIKQKKCKVCKNLFTPFNTLANACSVECALVLVKKDNQRKADKQAKERRKQHREAKKRLKSRNDWIKEAQAEFNKYVRLRDANEPCISCGRHHNGQYHAGHYLSTGASPELRFHPYNNNKQCAPCNNHLSGNQVRYRARLIDKIGIENVEFLEGPHMAQKWTVFDIQEIKEYYKQLTKELKNEA